jgi:hypothetical protein
MPAEDCGMTDPILTARIEALRHSLALVKRTVDLLDEMIPDDDEAAAGDARGRGRLHPGLRKNLKTQVDQLVKNRQDELAKIRQEDGIDAAWRQYAQVQERSQELFGGCFEFIGGAAFREAMGRGEADREDRKIADVADELMVEAASAAFGQPDHYFTVPALEDALNETRVRTIRLRFPDWTIWNLPLMAHEFGHVTIADWVGLNRDDPYPLRTALEELTTTIMARDEALVARLKAATGEDHRARIARRAEKAARRRVRVLFADAFATRWMGPAYACAALHLRFDPSAAFSTNPSFDERAHMVLDTLDAIAGDEDPGNVVASLREQWSSAVEQADPPDPSAGTPDDACPVIGDAVRSALTDALPTASEYTTELWYRALARSKRWTSQGQMEEDLSTKPEPGDGLRDVLNAVWLCRLKNPTNKDLLKEVARVALAQCQEIAKSGRQQRAAAEQRGALSTPMTRVVG